jgi:hypothetical protein
MTNLITIYSFRYSCNNVFDTVSFDCHWKPVICQSMMGV